MVGNFCIPSPTKIDTDDIYSKYLYSKEADFRQDSDQYLK